MPSVRGGSELTGLSRRNLAVDDEFRSAVGVSPLPGALNWKNSYSAEDNCQSWRTIEHSREFVHQFLILCSRLAHLLPLPPDLLFLSYPQPSSASLSGTR